MSEETGTVQEALDDIAFKLNHIDDIDRAISDFRNATQYRPLSYCKKNI